ncbi:GNAT family N-acetyltransferase [Vibrio diazotrophicus]|uniref:GNAT family N-acetyltransferase n=1 Tax=Vibrio diazotrophicus TaxID=685 RepID=UPI00142D76EB|nr:GNAT family N-acetyltransferase [Vibrio diazotrophicus]NIY92932.1 GNAT family N-acetyltransferase [Vibrio diazotrophicus]
MKFDITIASSRYASQIAILTQELGYKANAKDTETWLTQLGDSPLHCVYIAVSDNHVCGWLVVEKRMFLESGTKAEITGLVVGKQYRCLGIAQALVKAAQNWAMEQGLQTMVVRSNVERVESHLFYPKVGFDRSKTTHVYTKSLKDSE